MFIIFQKIWIFLIVDVFLIYIVFQIARGRLQEKNEKTFHQRRQIKKHRGSKIFYYFFDQNGKGKEGEIDHYPCTLGRGKNCDVVILEQSKNGNYYLSREFITIMEVNQEFRVTRCQRPNEKQRVMSGKADGIPFSGEISIKFQEKLEIKVANNMRIYLKKKELKTDALL